MATYHVKAPDGSLHALTGPAGATPEQVVAQALKLVPRRHHAPPPQQVRAAHSPAEVQPELK